MCVSGDSATLYVVLTNRVVICTELAVVQRNNVAALLIVTQHELKCQY
jgi:hypothetical protein